MQDPHLEFSLGPFDALPDSGKEPAGESVFGVIKYSHRRIKVPGADDGQHRPKNLVLAQAGISGHFGKNRGFDIVAAIPVYGVAARQEFRLSFAALDSRHDLPVLSSEITAATG